MRRCSAESELLQQVPSNVGLVHGVGQMFTMETTSTPFYVAIPMNFFSHVPFEVSIRRYISFSSLLLCTTVCGVDIRVTDSYYHSMDMSAIRRYMLALCRSVSQLHKLGLAHRYMFRAYLLKCM